MQDRRVVVTGMAALTPIGLSVESFWQGMMEGKSGAALITKFDASRVATKFACELKGYDPLNYLDRKSARRMDLFAQYAMSVAKDVIKDAGLDPETMSSEDKDDTGVMIGSGIGGMNIFEDQALTLANQGPNRVSPFFIPMLIPDIASGQVSIEFGFRGPNYCAVSACATSNHNFIDSFMLIKEGQAEMMIVGGTEGPVCELGVAGFNSAQALSKRNDSPETASRPFDKTRDGFVMGEGAGVLVLEELGHAVRRGAKIYAEVVGYGLSGDAYHITAPDPEGRGARLAMHRALKYAGIEPDMVDYINMHGTSTELGDIAETQSIKAVFGDQAYKMNLSSTKSMTGHLLGAAGAVEAIATILAIKNGKIPPTINFEHSDPECDLNYTFNQPQEREVNYAMSNAFGFGGHNTSIIFKKFEE
ncbi:MAG: beta-ketoacyl-ACP synthase II [Ignavibacteriales bacterium]|nr:MAG: beta-ketoacyl-ACP synthase II [Ignavibacteriaceae bacterium]MBW7873160.1 beta-ketoacyl-ACP synthase II [Ignavibacteria bacterium]MCZ2142802.1 beta-ketoacyl-ACP synthase II [Ignavibacteriales bacterium]MBV6443896.1 3-oxoacyl-[acyl-carrier-protein] synthase 2 [Ignavibacteriaceae bacterium]MBZ0196261.1 beta-ketoacyl-ACP synthase II [Ignavibacteriaceae bacterium]